MPTVRHRSISSVGFTLPERGASALSGATRPAPAPSRIQLIAYDEHSVIEEPNLTPEALRHRFSENQPERVNRLIWVNLTSPHDSGALEAASAAFGLHPLALEDASNLHLQQRPKAEGYDRHLFIVLNIPIIHTATGDVDIHQVALFFGRDFIVTVQEGDRVTDACDATVWENVRERIRKGTGRIRAKGADWLAYALIDAAVDHYFPVLEIVDTRVEHLEDEVIEAPDRKTVSRIHTIRRELLVVRRAAWPTREAIAALMRDYGDRFSEETRLFLRDIYDHVVQVIELEETDREVVAGLMDIYLSNINQRMNEVMKVLTIIATVFMPLSFIVGVYGMNF
ncbi:MAG: magnesium and cobalt transport protein CorA, partial [Planctomycetes bacterium]|nr:magnesium and cobalt transport protein CorA [Planctomycetota bacterium]